VQRFFMPCTQSVWKDAAREVSVMQLQEPAPNRVAAVSSLSTGERVAPVRLGSSIQKAQSDV
jgi:hypothetical protein